MKSALISQGETGDTLLRTTTRGPQADKMQFDRIMGYIKSAQDDGLSIVTGGKEKQKKGYYIEPTIITNAPEDHRVVRDEIFGPVVIINTFTDEKEVLKLANGKLPHFSHSHYCCSSTQIPATCVQQID